MKSTTALALIGKDNKIIPEFIISKKRRKEYELKKGEKWAEVLITITKQNV